MKNPFQNIRIFWGEMIRELKKASWPSFKELRNSTVIVLVAIALLGIFTSVSDFALLNIVEFFTNIVRS